MEYMVIETFKPGKKVEVYSRYQDKGRILPDGLEYIDSWVEVDGDRCFQLMKTENRTLFDKWMKHWEDLVEFEIIPIVPTPTNSPNRF